MDCKLSEILIFTPCSNWKHSLTHQCLLAKWSTTSSWIVKVRDAQKSKQNPRTPTSSHDQIVNNNRAGERFCRKPNMNQVHKNVCFSTEFQERSKCCKEPLENSRWTVKNSCHLIVNIIGISSQYLMNFNNWFKLVSYMIAKIPKVSSLQEILKNK